VDRTLAQYGPAMVDRVDFARGRVRSSFAVDVSAGAELYRRDQWLTTLQADIQNLNNRLNVLDFGGLFSGNAIAPPRSYMLRAANLFLDSLHDEVLRSRMMHHDRRRGLLRFEQES
jgi:hypothetical protein